MAQAKMQLSEPRRASLSEQSQITNQSLYPAPIRPALSATNRRPTELRELVQRSFASRGPAITGEAVFRGAMNVECMLSGQVGGGGGTLVIRQRAGSEFVSDFPELDGELFFKELLRVNGHIAGTVLSERGTLIVDSGARVDGHVEVGVAVVGGVVNGDIVAQQRVELGPNARVTGNIQTRSLMMEQGAVFDGVCGIIRGGEPGEAGNGGIHAIASDHQH